MFRIWVKSFWMIYILSIFRIIDSTNGFGRCVVSFGVVNGSRKCFEYELNGFEGCMLWFKYFYSYEYYETNGYENLWFDLSIFVVIVVIDNRKCFEYKLKDVLEDVFNTSWTVLRDVWFDLSIFCVISDNRKRFWRTYSLIWILL